MQQEEPGTLAEHPIPELYALLRAIERMWGGADAKQLTAPPELMYYLAVYATYAHHIPEDVEDYRASAAHNVRAIQGFMESVALAIENGSVVEPKEDGMYIDLFRIAQWFYDEAMNEHTIITTRIPHPPEPWLLLYTSKERVI